MVACPCTESVTSNRKRNLFGLVLMMVDYDPLRIVLSPSTLRVSYRVPCRYQIILFSLIFVICFHITIRRNFNAPSHSYVYCISPSTTFNMIINIQNFINSRNRIWLLGY